MLLVFHWQTSIFVISCMFLAADWVVQDSDDLQTGSAWVTILCSFQMLILLRCLVLLNSSVIINSEQYSASDNVWCCWLAADSLSRCMLDLIVTFLDYHIVSWLSICLAWEHYNPCSIRCPYGQRNQEVWTHNSVLEELCWLCISYKLSFWWTCFTVYLPVGKLLCLSCNLGEKINTGNFCLW